MMEKIRSMMEKIRSMIPEVRVEWTEEKKGVVVGQASLTLDMSRRAYDGNDSALVVAVASVVIFFIIAMTA